MKGLLKPLDVWSGLHASNRRSAANTGIGGIVNGIPTAPARAPRTAASKEQAKRRLKYVVGHTNVV